MPEDSHLISAAAPGPAELISARIERLPFTRFHARILAVVGSASFFDGFDSLTIAYVLPVLVGLWALSNEQVGLLISIGYVGQLIGAIAFTWAAERVGRLRALRWTIAVTAILSAACALAWSYSALLMFRAVQGLGLGGEVPLGATYINEFTSAKIRGRVVFSLQFIYATGLLITAYVAALVVPAFGWTSMFIIGTAPILIAIWLPRLAPESPRWLASHGKVEAAAQILSSIEQSFLKSSMQPLPPLASNIQKISKAGGSIRNLFEGIYKSRTLSVWTCMFCYSTISTAMATWLPTIYRTVYHLSLTNALYYSLSIYTAQLVGAIIGMNLIDRIGRRSIILTCFIGGALPILFLGLGPTPTSPTYVMIFVTIGYLFLGCIIQALYVYAPEIYPTRVRALGAGVATSWLRIATIISPTIVGFILSHFNVTGAFLYFGGIGLVGALVTYFFVIETKGRILEELSP